MSEQAFKNGLNEGRRAERAAIVAWLRAQGKDGAEFYRSACTNLAGRIERADHLPNPTDGG